MIHGPYNIKNMEVFGLGYLVLLTESSALPALNTQKVGRADCSEISAATYKTHSVLRKWAAIWLSGLSIFHSCYIQFVFLFVLLQVSFFLSLILTFFSFLSVPFVYSISFSSLYTYLRTGIQVSHKTNINSWSQLTEHKSVLNILFTIFVCIIILTLWLIIYNDL
jgi:hypothetical protein